MNGMPKPLVSVVIPAWNAEATIGETLASAAAQTYRNLEIVIVDDGSTDGTAAAALDFASRDPRARLVQKPNGGLSSARNFGIAESRGDWIAPLDADDLWHPTKLEKQVEAALSAGEPPGFVYCWFHYVDEAGNVIGSGPSWDFSGSAQARMAYVKPVQNGSSILISRAAATAAGGYDESLREGCEDIMFEMQVARSHGVACVPEYLVGYRLHPGSMSADHRKMNRAWDLVHERLRGEAAIPAQVFRWIQAARDLEFAERSYSQGLLPDVVRHLTQALAADPIRSSGYLLYRLARMGARLARGRKRLRALPFSEAGMRESYPWDADELPRVRRLFVDLLEERRVSRLARVEARLARS